MAKRDIQSNKKFNAIVFVAMIFLILMVTRQAGFCSLESRESGVVKAVRRAGPAVVNISSQYEIRKNSNPFSGYGMDPMLEKFFRDFFSPELERREKRTSLGSGVIIDGSRGFVLTNTHVVEKAATIGVMLNDEREFEATIVGMDPDSDLAVLKVQTDQTLPAIQMGDSDDIMIGESVIAIGNPFGFSNTVTTGVVSAVKRSIKTGERVYHEFIQTDASINPGNSGGPLLNIDGELIGINTAIYAEAQGIGFAIPINRARRIISDLIQFGEVIQPWIGLSVQPIDNDLSEYLKINSDSGVIVTAVEPDSPAHEAGFHEGDIIRTIDGKRINHISEYRMKMSEIPVGKTIVVDIYRNQQTKQLSLTTTVFPIEQALDMAYRRLGIVVAAVDQEIRNKYGIRSNNGVLITKIQHGSYLDRIGVRPADIIRQIDASTVNSLADFKSAIVKYRNKSSLVILIERHGYLYYINAILKDG